MRTLVLFRGAPGCGKTTFINNIGWKRYTLSPDDLRRLYQTPTYNEFGKFYTGFDFDGEVWKLIYQIAEKRFERGEFTVIDATNSQTHEMTKWKALAQKYHYRIYLIDMTDVPIETVLERNAGREDYKVVPEEAIYKMYNRFATQKVPSGITVIKPDEAPSILRHPVDISEFKELKIIGDVHGCYDTLTEALGEIDPDTLYVFCGDLCDRGTQNAEMVNFFLDHYKDKNMIFLEGNHEKHLFAYSKDLPARSKEFMFKTKPQLDEAGIDKKELRRALHKMQQCSWLYTSKVPNVSFFICHGGIALTPDTVNPLLIPTYNLIKGTGDYETADEVADTYECDFLNTEHGYNDSVIQFHGHRKSKDIPGCFYCLEDDVEHGGNLCIAEIDLEDLEYSVHKYPNTHYVKPEPIDYEGLGVQKLIMDMRDNYSIREKDLGDHISSFSFTRDAFRRKDWNSITTKARGLFVDVKNCEIVARSYNKFFNFSEVEETSEAALRKNLKFPLTAYYKVNGFLGILSWNKQKDEPLFCSKSTNKGDYARMFEERFESQYSVSQKALIFDKIKENNVSIVFEVCDMRDKHIVEELEGVVMLDIIYNEINFRKVPYEKWNEFFGDDSLKFSYKCKYALLEGRLNTPDELFKNIEITKKIASEEVISPFEGIVIEDANGYMFKVKTDYYNIWKRNRSMLSSVLNTGKYKTGQVEDLESLKFYQFIREKNISDRETLKNLARGKNGSNNIIDVRNWFYECGADK